MENLKQVLEEAERRVNAFYQTAISLHNNQHLRSLAGVPIRIVAPEREEPRDGEPRLYYGTTGFYAAIPRCTDRGSYCENASYLYPEFLLQEEDGKLFVKNHDGTEEMLHVFPNLTTGLLEQKVIEGVKKGALFKDNP